MPFLKRQISEIRQETKSQKLSNRLVKCHTNLKSKFCNAETQTEQENFLIERYFQESHAIPVNPPSPKKKRKNPTKKRRKSPKAKVQEEPPPAAPVAEKDEIEANLEKLFASEHNELDIFDNAGEFDPHIKLVLSEAKDPPVKATEEVRSPKLPVSEENQKDSLRDSIWPCELRMRRKKLYEIMCSVGEFSLRRYERLKVVFLELFGEDSDDEEAPISPSTDMDSITMSSCRKRIAPIIVKQLMKPFNEGLIANRWLFKKLAKSLADSIVIENDYPGENGSLKTISQILQVPPYNLSKTFQMSDTSRISLRITLLFIPKLLTLPTSFEGKLLSTKILLRSL